MSNFYTVTVRENNSGGWFTFDGENRKGGDFSAAVEDEFTVRAKNARGVERAVYDYMMEMYGIDYRKDNRESCDCCGVRWYFTVTTDVDVKFVSFRE